MPRAAMEMDGLSSAKSGAKSIRKGKTTSSNGHDCNICLKSNMTLSGLKIHLLTHSGEKPYLCTVCDKRFTCSSNLKKHQRIHNKDYIYACEVCGKTCSDPSNMKKHMTVHSGEKAYVCPSCGKQYSYAQSLRQHMDDVHVENGEKRLKNKRKGHFPCPECGKVFGYYWRCSLHQARVHAVDRPYKCPECGKCFARETILNKHLQTHEKPYACTECERRFSFRDQLHKHSRTHSGERPYQCETCLKSFSQRGSLTEHMRTHTGLKPFACQICGMKFASSSSLRRHERKVKSCFPAPPGEEITIGSMYPAGAIYVSTPPMNIPRVETRPVIDNQGLQNSYMEENSYVGGNPYIGENPYMGKNPYEVENPSSSSSMAQISTVNNLFTGLNPTSPSAESNNDQYNEIDKNVDVNGNFEATMVPNSQISMVVRCDKNGKISVLPVTLQLVNGTTQFSTTEGGPNDPATNEPGVTTSNYHLNALTSASNNGQRTFSEPTNTRVTMAISNDHHPSCVGIPTTMDTDSFSTMSNPTVHQHPPLSPTNRYTISMNTPSLPTMVTTNPLSATNPPITASAKNLPLPSHQITTSDDGTAHSSTMTHPNPNVSVQENLHTKIVYGRSLQSAPLIDANNNNVVNANFILVKNLPAKYVIVNTLDANKHLPAYVATTNGYKSISHLDKPTSTLVSSTNNNHQPSSIYGEATKYNVPVSTTNGYCEQLPPHILLPRSMTRPSSTVMELSTSQSCYVKTEPEDIKPVIGVDVPAFDQ